MHDGARLVDGHPAERSAREIMESFARRTGLTSEGTGRRYLWTDAFAVSNWLSLFGRSGDPRFAEAARLLIDRVHHVLGRHRSDDARSGWISGLGEAEGERHPTAGGLRIGKPLPERGPRELLDARLEWERDGQYYHYLLRWTHALSRAGAVLHDRELQRWAVELAVVAERAFAHQPHPGARPSLYWKMSIDLTRALVPSQGAHDPLDGLVTACVVAAGGVDDASAADLGRAARELADMCRAEDLATVDPLGVGGLLCDLWWSTQLLQADAPHSELLEPLLRPMAGASVLSLRELSRSPVLTRSPDERLAFRELGLAVGLRAAGELVGAVPGLAAHLRPPDVDELERYLPLADRIVAAWLPRAARTTPSWRAHEDINDVMLATALLPDEHLQA